MKTTQNDCVIGLFFGDETKGLTTAFLTNQQPTNSVIKIAGGPQTLHHVQTSDGKLHGFQQFGSGFFNGIPTIISKYFLVNPYNLVVEAEKLYNLTGVNPFDTLTLSENSLLITPLHRLINKAREDARGNNRHGSCGQGIGEAKLYLRDGNVPPPLVGDILKPHILHDKLKAYQTWAENTFPHLFPLSNAKTVDEIVEDLTNMNTDLHLNIVSDNYILEQAATGYNVFEAAQGVLLDESYGFHPHTTWSTTTADNARELSKEAGIPTPRTVGAMRVYGTRHGHGPFPSEHTNDTSTQYPELQNKAGHYQGAWRIGDLDLALLEYAVRANKGIDVLSISHYDYAKFPNHEIVTGYKNLPHIPTNFYNCDRNKQEEITKLLATPELINSAQRVRARNEEELNSYIFDTLKPNHNEFIRGDGPTQENKTWVKQ